MKKSFSVLITDLDNTLFDWFEIWYQSFNAMLDKIIEISGVDREKLLDEIRSIHQRHRTSEYVFLIDCIKSHNILNKHI